MKSSSKSSIHAHHFNDHFPCQPGLADCHLNSQSPVILILSILTGLCTHMVLRAELYALTITLVAWAIPLHSQLTLTAISRGFEAEVFTGWMPFLSPNQVESTASEHKGKSKKRHAEIKLQMID